MIPELRAHGVCLLGIVLASGCSARVEVEVGRVGTPWTPEHYALLVAQAPNASGGTPIAVVPPGGIHLLEPDGPTRLWALIYPPEVGAEVERCGAIDADAAGGLLIPSPVEVWSTELTALEGDEPARFERAALSPFRFRYATCTPTTLTGVWTGIVSIERRGHELPIKIDLIESSDGALATGTVTVEASPITQTLPGVQNCVRTYRADLHRDGNQFMGTFEYGCPGEGCVRGELGGTIELGTRVTGAFTFEPGICEVWSGRLTLDRKS